MTCHSFRQCSTVHAYQSVTQLVLMLWQGASNPALPQESDTSFAFHSVTQQSDYSANIPTLSAVELASFRLCEGGGELLDRI